MVTHVMNIYPNTKYMCVDDLVVSDVKHIQSGGVGSFGCKGICCVRTFTDTGTEPPYENIKVGRRRQVEVAKH